MRRHLQDLATPRYAAVTGLMVVIAAICVLAGTWQISRYDSKHLANDDIKANARDVVAPVAAVLPLVGDGRAPDEETVEYRTVTATGTYDTGEQTLLRLQQVDDTNGYTVLTPLRTTAGPTLLVARGFVPSDAPDLTPADVPAPPTGEVTVTGRVEASATDDDQFGVAGNGQVDSVNATEVARRLGTDVYAGFAVLETDQPGTTGLTVLPGPDLSNPAGGAFEWQHLAYVVQWYLFAGLALAGPFVVVRVDRKRAAEDARAVQAHLAVQAPVRTGAGALTAGADATGADLVRQDADRDHAAAVAAYEEHVREATERLADRYGR